MPRKPRCRLSDLSPQQVQDLMARTTDPFKLRSLVKLYDAIMLGDELLMIEAEDELDGMPLGDP
jgi:hypothetical protein